MKNSNEIMFEESLKEKKYHFLIIKRIIFFLKIVWRVWDDRKEFYFRIPIKTAWEVANIIYPSKEKGIKND